MSIITLVTDFGLKDHYVSLLKAKLIRLNSNSQIVDISHLIDKFNLYEASYLLNHSCFEFPENTIHLALVNAYETIDVKPIVIFCNGHYFLGGNNGIFGFLKHSGLNYTLYNVAEFLSKYQNPTDGFINLSFQIQSGIPLNNLGIQEYELKDLGNIYKPTIVDQNILKGTVVYIDDFGNCITNISKDFIETHSQGRTFQIKFYNYTINKVRKHYFDYNSNDVASIQKHAGDKIAIFNEQNQLEIGLLNSNTNTVGSASSLLGLKFRDIITIEFIN